ESTTLSRQDQGDSAIIHGGIWRQIRRRSSRRLTRCGSFQRFTDRGTAGAGLYSGPPGFATRRSMTMTALEPIPYSDAKLRRILSTVRTIAMVGASSNWNRPSYFVMKYLQGKGYRVIPVNPGTAGKEQLGEKIYAGLRDIPDQIDMVDIFRSSDQVAPI